MLDFEELLLLIVESSELSAHFVSVKNWHVEVQKYEVEIFIWLTLKDALKSFEAIDGLLDLHVKLAEVVTYCHHLELVIVGNYAPVRLILLFSLLQFSIV